MYCIARIPRLFVYYYEFRSWPWIHTYQKSLSFVARRRILLLLPRLLSFLNHLSKILTPRNTRIPLPCPYPYNSRIRFYPGHFRCLQNSSVFRESSSERLLSGSILFPTNSRLFTLSDLNSRKHFVNCHFLCKILLNFDFGDLGRIEEEYRKFENVLCR